MWYELTAVSSPYELRVSDYDGHNQFVVHALPHQPLMSPAARGLRTTKLAYVTFESVSFALVIQTLANGAVRQVASLPRLARRAGASRRMGRNGVTRYRKPEIWNRSALWISPPNSSDNGRAANNNGADTVPRTTDSQPLPLRPSWTSASV